MQDDIEKIKVNTQNAVDMEFITKNPKRDNLYFCEDKKFSITSQKKGCLLTRFYKCKIFQFQFIKENQLQLFFWKKEHMTHKMIRSFTGYEKIKTET